MNFYSTILNQLEVTPVTYKTNYLNRVKKMRYTLRRIGDLDRTSLVGVVANNPYKALPFLLACLADGYVPVVFPTIKAASNYKSLLPIKHGIILQTSINPFCQVNYHKLGWKKIKLNAEEIPSHFELVDIPKATLQDQPCIVMVIENEEGNFLVSGWTHNELVKLYFSLKKQPYDFFQFLLTNANLTPSNLWLKHIVRVNEKLSRFKFFNDWCDVSKWSVLSI